VSEALLSRTTASLCWRPLRGLVVLAAVLATWWPAPAEAHALLLRSEPAAGVVSPADQPPRAVVLSFSEPVDIAALSGVSVLDGEGRRVDHLDAHLASDDPRQV
jgi:methionine-rich copper-binding protein CopC